MCGVILVFEADDGVGGIVVVESEHFVDAVVVDIELIVFHFGVPVRVVGGIDKDFAGGPGETFFTFGGVDDVENVADDGKVVADDAETGLAVGEDIGVGGKINGSAGNR